MKLHTKKLQIGMNSAVAAHLLPHNPYRGPANGDF